MMDATALTESLTGFVHVLTNVNRWRTFSVPVATIQALGFATGTALYGLLLVMQRQADRRAPGVTYQTLWGLGLLWTAGSFALRLSRLAGLRDISTPSTIASVVAWASTCFGPLTVLYIVHREFPNRSRTRHLLLTISAIISVVLFALLIVSALSRPTMRMETVTLMTFFNSVLHGPLYAAMYFAGRRRVERAGVSRRRESWFLWATAGLMWVQALAIGVSIYASAQVVGVWVLVTAMIIGQQWMVPWAILVAVFLAQSNHADLVLKRTLALVTAIAVGTLCVWWIPGLPRGIPVVVLSLGLAALILAAPALQRGLNDVVDRGLLRRPRYEDLLRSFAEACRRTSSREQLFTLTTTRIADALHLEAQVRVPDETAALEHPVHTIELGSPSTGYFVLDLAPSNEGRVLMHEEIVFLEAIRVEATHRLEGLRFEQERRELQLREERLQHSLTQAELKALRAQVDPHFLFNTLNTITDLISSEPDKAEAMTERLADFFRYTLARTERTFTTLDQELDFVRQYLDIEQVRFGERLHVTLLRDPLLGAELVPPLILQPLVENAVKHGLAPRIEGGTIAVSATRDNGFLTLQIADDGVGMRGQADNRAGGIGLQNVRDRLRALYQDTARMTIEPGENGAGTRVTLHLPRHAH